MKVIVIRNSCNIENKGLKKVIAIKGIITFISPNSNKEYSVFNVEVKTVYAHTGFIEQNGKKVFLYHGGNIGADGNNEIETDLTENNLKFSIPQKVPLKFKGNVFISKSPKCDNISAALALLYVPVWDRNSRVKLNSKGELHQKYAPQGLGMVTAERQPKFSQSRLARAMTIYTQEGSINFGKLKEIHAKKDYRQYIFSKKRCFFYSTESSPKI